MLRVKFKMGPVRIASRRISSGKVYAKIEKLPIKLPSRIVNPEIRDVRINGSIASCRRLFE